MAAKNSEILSKLISSFMDKRDLSLRDFATLCGLSHTYIDKLKKGFDSASQKPVEPTMDTLDRLAKAMGMALRDLLIKCEYIKEGEPRKFFLPEEVTHLLPEHLRGLVKDRLGPFSTEEEIPVEKLSQVAEELAFALELILARNKIKKDGTP